MAIATNLKQAKEDDLVFFRHGPNDRLETRRIFEADHINVFLRWVAPACDGGYLIVRFNRDGGFQNGGGFVAYHSIHPFDLKHTLEFIYDTIAKRILRLMSTRRTRQP